MIQTPAERICPLLAYVEKEFDLNHTQVGERLKLDRRTYLSMYDCKVAIKDWRWEQIIREFKIDRNVAAKLASQKYTDGEIAKLAADYRKPRKRKARR